MIQNWANIVSRETLEIISKIKNKVTLEIPICSFIPMLIAEQNKGRKNRTILIFDDEIKISRFIEDLESIDNLLDILHYKEQDWAKVYSEEHELQLISERMEALKFLQESGSSIVCLSAKSLLNKVPSPTKFREEKLVIKQGMELSYDSFISRLTNYGFYREDFISKPGDYSIRGGIFDVYSFGSEHPIRIEFWGNLVDSIRYFDVKTQRSIDTISEISILPNFQKTVTLERQVCFFEYAKEDDQIIFINKDYIYQLIPELMEKNPHSTLKSSEFDEYLELLNWYEIKSLVLDKKNYLDDDKLKLIPQSALLLNEENLKDKLIEWVLDGYTIYLGYDQESQLTRILNFINDEAITSKIVAVRPSIHEGFVLEKTKKIVIAEHLIFSRFRRLQKKHQVQVRNTVKIDNPYELKRGDFVVHVDHGIGKFIGLTKIKIGNKESEVVKLQYTDEETLFVNVKKIEKIQKFSSRDGYSPVLTKLGSTDWTKKKEQTKKKIKDIARDLILLYSKRKQEPGFQYSKDTAWQNELEASFLFEDTPDQIKTTEDVKRDMELPHPMDRLVCGDVGFGKTEIAVRAAFKAVQDGKQVAVLVPTTILAQQHYSTFKARMENFPVRINVISRFRSEKEQKETVKKVGEGEVDILIGTHRILSKDIIYKDLGLLIVDEEHRFGVADKEKIKALKVNIDVLAMSATPIPRTMQLSLMGARDISIIATAPPNRIPVEVKIEPFNEQKLKEIVKYEMNREGQIFFIHNRVKSIYNMGQYLNRLFPKLRIRIAHGQMPPKELEEIMVGFMNHDFDMLISTNIIESGVDIPNSNSIIINRADRFGLSELYQLKGRVGRSNKPGFCYLMTPPTEMMKKMALKRLMTIEEFTDLGSGFNVAMRDMDIRGAGNILGGEQSGFVNTIGFEMYNNLLEDAVEELKDEEFKDLFDRKNKTSVSKDVVVETSFPSYLPQDYVESSTERFDLYKRLTQLTEPNKIHDFQSELKDRFGILPVEAETLIHETLIKLIVEKIGAQKINITQLELTLLFPEKTDKFYKSGYFESFLLKLTSLKQKHTLKEIKNHLLLIVNISGISQQETIRRLIEIEKILEGLRVV